MFGLFLVRQQSDNHASISQEDINNRAENTRLVLVGGNGALENMHLWIYGDYGRL